MKKDNSNKKITKKNILICSVVILLVAAIVVCGFWFIPEEGTAKHLDINADTSVNLLPESQVISGGTAQNLVDEFSEEFSGAAFTVNGEPVDGNIMEFAVNDFAMRYARSLMFTGAVPEGKAFDWNAKDPNFNGTYLDYVKYQTLEEFVPRYALIAEGKRRGVVLTDEERREAQNWCREKQGDKSDAEFEKILKEGGCPDVETFIAFREFSMLEAKVYADFEKNPQKYATRDLLLSADSRELVSVQHILVAFNPENPSGEFNDTMKADARKRAEGMLKDVKTVQDFGKYAEENTDDVQTNYIIGADDDYDPSFKEAAFALKVGEISGLVETAYGYHIIKRIEREPSITDYIILLNRNAKITINRKVFNKLSVTVDMNKYFDNVMKSFMK